jgi:hypothetical protein
MVTASPIRCPTYEQFSTARYSLYTRTLADFSSGVNFLYSFV